MYARKMLYATILIVVTATFTNSSHATLQNAVETHDTTKLMVLFVPRNAAEIMRPSEVVAAIRAKGKTDRQVVAHARFGFPNRATRLLGDNAPEPDIVLPSNGTLDPDEIVHQYLLLEYDSPQIAVRARALMKQDPGVLWVEHPAFMHLSTSIPSDPGASQGSYTSPFDYQWALGSLNLYAAWDLARGHAYVGHVDIGVKTGETLNPAREQAAPNTNWYPNGVVIHPDLSQSFRPHRVWSAINAQAIPTVGNSIVVDDFIFNIGASRWSILDYIGNGPNPTITPAEIVRGHGTHTAGIIAANVNFSGTQSGYPNPPSLGVSGVCWNCSLHVAKITRADNPNLNEFDVAAAMGWAMSTGVQVINLSLGSDSFSPGNSYPASCNDAPYNVQCANLALAAQREIVVVAAAGNSGAYGLDFPASDGRTIAAGAIDSAGTRLAFSRYGPDMLTRGLVAPGKDVLSTVYTNQVYDASAPCGDGYGRFAGQGFGPCTGTSMSAPFITGIVALMRSVNPLLSAGEIRNRLLGASDRASNRDIFYGAGKPNALSAINAVLADTNRLSPLFSLQTANPSATNPRNYLYTTFPQVGAAASNGSFLPAEIGAGPFASYGNPVASYPTFPGGALARAETWIFTTHVNPHNAVVDLKPLYRLSRRCYVGAPSCNSDSIDVDHFYTTDYAEVQSMIAMGWGHTFDGIEGYVFPAGGTNQQPTGTVPLIRATASVGSPGYKHAIFPATMASQMASLGYQYLLKTLGYVYLNPPSGAKPTYAF